MANAYHRLWQRIQRGADLTVLVFLSFSLRKFLDNQHFMSRGQSSRSFRSLEEEERRVISIPADGQTELIDDEPQRGWTETIMS